VTSARKIRANRANARASSGPKTATGKAQSAQNAFRHGFNVPVRLDPDLASDVEALAQRIVGKSADANVLEPARRVATDSTSISQPRDYLRPAQTVRPLVIVNRTASHLNSSVKRLCLFPLIVTSSILHRGWLSTFAGQVQIRFRPPWGRLISSRKSGSTTSSVSSARRCGCAGLGRRCSRPPRLRAS
jgi:hypothetical protein